ncbi:Pc22g22790 [Penicillium rubens Wisconsin 54-1255]|uniref:Pc22g22790 protein n=1 Tax=Penicillium rubens (strain ATCC 28089 / DSM 1075 / NRRL 1951 / Wisconsin 54-1255) TaxID=500485 RepID=B6HUQ1_PENRW|nr:Pc22g22790 [Penicillium rubens Wisconsin 54-1255]
MRHFSAVEERSVDEARRLRVVIIGAGISGILACIRFRQRIPNLDICVYEKNADIGGTWFENRYPGCACDIPAHTYQATFEPNKEWSTFYAKGEEIHQYWKHVAGKYGCMEHIKLRQQISEAVWNEEQSKWNLRIQDLASSSTYTDRCDVVIQATGALNNWKWPNIPGLEQFKGKLMHSASWDQTYDYKGNRVAVVGNGSSGIQIVPALLPDVPHIDHYARSRTWISPSFGREQIEKRGRGLDNYVELELQSIHGITLTGHSMQLGEQEVFTENMKRRLANKPGLIDELLPSFPPACRRLTPGPGYLEALTDDKVDLITSDIVKVDETGIITADGQHRPVDMLVCATGFDTSCTPRFVIRGREGVTLSEQWEQTPETYLSIATDGFPNYFISLGPNAGLGEGNLLLLIERALDYITECVHKMQRDNIRAMSVRREAVKRFTHYCDAYFAGTVFSSKCRSWYKGGTEDGRVTALWPGSSLHSMKVFANPRWEDFEYCYVNDNVFGWLGDGWTENEKHNNINVDYLDDNMVDFPRPMNIAK